MVSCNLISVASAAAAGRKRDIIDQDGDIAIVSLLAPTMPPALFTELGEAFARLSRDASLRA